MDDTDFEVLCEGASPEETKRVRKVLRDWAGGEENSFPVQMALLTRAHWRMAASLPHQVEDAHQRMRRDLAEYRQFIAAEVENFARAAEVQADYVRSTVAEHTRATKQVAAQMRGQLTIAEAVAKQITGQLERGAVQWQNATADFDAARARLEQARKELDSRQSFQTWLVYGLLVLALVGVGIAVGWHLPR